MSTLIKDRSSSAVTINNSIDTSSHIPSVDGVPIDLMNYFGFTPFDMDGDTRTKALDIWQHFSGEKEPMVKMAELERKLGKGGSDRVIDKMWRYAKLNNQIKSLMTQKELLYGNT